MADITSAITKTATAVVAKNSPVAAGANLAKNMVSSAASAVIGIFNNPGQSINLSDLVNLPDLDLIGALTQYKDLFELEGTPPFTNVLSAYTSYNYIFTLSVMDDYSLNFPNETYKKGQLGQIILRSGSTDSNNRVFIKDFGVFEFYIEDVEMDSTIGFQRSTGNTNMSSLKFKIVEPYSMGMFFHAMSAAADHVGHKTYTSAVFLLTLQFMGHVSASSQGVPGDALNSVEKTTRHFPIKMTSINMRVSASGSEYDIEAIPYNEQAMSTTYSVLKTDISISGSNVHEILQTGEHSLQAILNERLANSAEQQGLAVRDQVVIYFPNDLSSGSIMDRFIEIPSKYLSAVTSVTDFFSSTQTITEKLQISEDYGNNGTLVQKIDQINGIAKAPMLFNPYKDGNSPFGKDDLVYDDNAKVFKRGNMVSDPKKGELKFAQDTSIVNVINQVIVMSDFGRNALSHVTDSGKIVWWRVESNLYTMPSEKNMEINGMKPRLIVYRVVPYLVDSATFLPPNKKNPKLENAKAQALKEYNYIYTGQNTEVIDFEMTFNNSFYKAMAANTPNNSGDVVMANKMASASAESTKNTDKSVFSISSKIFGELNKLEQTMFDVIIEERNDKTIFSNSNQGGAGLNDPDTLLAKQAHDIILSGLDNVSPHMKIMGDPYFIADSGWGNYTGQSTNFENITADHSMDYQSGEVDIIVNFRTPMDANTVTGSYQFGDSKIISQFSGLYQVFKVTSSFNKGKFTQELKLNRRPGQL